MHCCYGCARRAVGCHAECQDYQRDRADYEAKRAYERRFGYVDGMPNTQTAINQTYTQKKRGGKQ